MRVAPRLIALAVLCAGVLLSAALPATAHESRKVGPYEFVVGWGEEPVYTGFKNSIQLILSDAKTGKPVNDLEDTLDVEVAFGDETTTLTMEPNFVPGVFGEEGDYRAWLTPTRPGEYTFRFVGTIGDTNIDDSFTSGPDTFDSPVDEREIQFPAQDPSTAELASRLERELPRVEQEATAVAQDAADDVSQAQTVSYVALALGLVGVILGAIALTRSSRGRSNPPTSASSPTDDAPARVRG